MQNTRGRTGKNLKKQKKTENTVFAAAAEGGLLSCLISNLRQKNRKLLKAVLRDGQVAVDGKTVTQFDHVITPGQTVEVQWERLPAERGPREFDIIFEDQHLIIINKPSGLLTVATEKEKRKTAYSLLSSYVKQEDERNKIFIIHRLDRETSGLLMFARSETVQQNIQESWRKTISQRTYVGVVEGQVELDSGSVMSYLRESTAFKVYSSQNPTLGRKAVTHYNKLQGNENYSLLKINLETGRKHQIRVHMQDIGHPIAGDKKYGSGLNPMKRMALHAQVLAFTHPVTGESCIFETDIPHDFLALTGRKKRA